MGGVSLLALVLSGVLATPESQWIVSAYGGAAFNRPADVRLEQTQQATSLRFNRVPLDDRSFESPIYYGYRVARKIPRTRRLFAGGELIHAKAFADGTRSGAGVYRGGAVQAIPFAAVLQRFAMSHGLNFVLANASLRHPLGDRMTGTLTFGAGPMVPHVEAQMNGVVEDAYQLGGVGTQASAGAEVRVWRRISVLIDYKWTRAALRLKLGSARADLTIHSHHVAAGLSAAF